MEERIKEIEKMKGILIDLFDHSGNAADPYRKAGWHIIQVDIKHGIDILEFDYKAIITKAVNNSWRYSTMPKIGILAAIPCTDYATSGAKHFAQKDANGSTAKSDLLVDRTYDIITFVKDNFSLDFWKVENPRTRIHKRHKWLGNITQKFNPCDFSGYTNPNIHTINCINEFRGVDMMDVSKVGIQAVMEVNAYNKETWLFGKFNKMVLDRIEPVWKENPGWRLYGGKSERTKELRSIDPKGYCQAFFEANN